MKIVSRDRGGGYGDGSLRAPVCGLARKGRITLECTIQVARRMGTKGIESRSGSLLCLALVWQNRKILFLHPGDVPHAALVTLYGVLSIDRALGVRDVSVLMRSLSNAGCNFSRIPTGHKHRAVLSAVKAAASMRLQNGAHDMLVVAPVSSISPRRIARSMPVVGQTTNWVI